MAERLLTIPEAAERLAVKVGTLRKWVFFKRLNCVRLGRAVRLRESDIEAITKDGFK